MISVSRKVINLFFLFDLGPTLAALFDLQSRHLRPLLLFRPNVQATS